MSASITLQQAGIIAGMLAAALSICAAVLALLDRRRKRTDVVAVPEPEQQRLAQECAVALTRMAAVLDTLRGGLRSDRQLLFRRSRFDVVFDDLAGMDDQLDDLLSRLRVVFGDDPAVAAFEEADGAVMEIQRVLTRIESLRDPTGLPKYVVDLLREIFDGESDEIVEQSKRFDAAKTAFERAAAARMR